VPADAAALRKATRQLREEFTAEKRDALLRTVEESAE
jgi:hypothetical protein